MAGSDKNPSHYWPKQFPRHLVRPYITLSDVLQASVKRYADRPAIRFFGAGVSYQSFNDQVEAFAGWLKQRADVRRGERVVLYLQNSPQWLIAYFGVLRADAVVVPVNPMNRAAELAHYLSDSGAKIIVCAQNLLDQVKSATLSRPLDQTIVATYSDYLPPEPEYALPAWMTEPRQEHAGTVAWADVIAAGHQAPPPEAVPGDLCCLPYTSGSTGVPKACMHTHETLIQNLAGLVLWHGTAPGTVCLSLSPMYHISGVTHSVHLPIYVGGTAVILPRWDQTLALQLLEREQVEHASIPPTAVIDLLAHRDLKNHDLSRLRRVTAGGATMPIEVAARLADALGVAFIEGYGMTESAATTHINPVDRPKGKSIGVPFFDTEALVVDPITLQVLGLHEQGEILVSGPQLFKGYWNRPDETAAAFVEINGRSYMRTGDVGYFDEEGYFFITDRAKRMINASGYKVWPSEVEIALYAHPQIHEVCVIGVPDARRGETVKALIVRNESGRQTLTEEAVIAWSRERMAAYKYPRVVEFVESLPTSAAGKILWRELQEAEKAKAKVSI